MISSGIWRRLHVLLSGARPDPVSLKAVGASCLPVYESLTLFLITQHMSRFVKQRKLLCLTQVLRFIVESERCPRLSRRLIIILIMLLLLPHSQRGKL